MNPDVVLTVAGTDSGGAAGIAADLATFAALGAHGACVVTAVTAQDTTGVRDVHAVPLASIEAQVDAVLDDLPLGAVKTGVLGTPDSVELVARRLGHLPCVVDPVLVATSGATLGDAAVVAALRAHLLPVAAVVTPNADEARALLGTDETDPRALADGLTDLTRAAIVTGGDEGAGTDWLGVRGHPPRPFTHDVVVTRNDHGTGCTFSAALAVHLAAALPLPDAVRLAAAYTTDRLRAGSGWTLGRGRGPVAHTAPAHPDREGR